MKIVITGGHLSPALAVIEKLGNSEIYYIGRKHSFEGDSATSLEYEEIVKLRVPFYSINAARLQRRFTKHTIPSLTKFPVGFFQSLKILRQIKPDIVLGFGGYISLPVILAAFLLRIPIVIHEQTLEAGFANKIEAKFAQKICISWQSSEQYFPKQKTVLTGNPLRGVVLNAKPFREETGLPKIYITGGSSGSHAINLLVEKSLKELLEKFTVVHQTGDARRHADFERLQSAVNKLDSQLAKNYHSQRFFSPEDTANNLSRSNLVVGRAGLNTVTELIYFKTPAFLIPLPFSQRNEQLKNALFLKGLGLGEIGLQNELTPEIFVAKILAMLKNLEKYRLEQNVLVPEAAQNIVKVLKDVATKKTA
ncbi:MAG TPA: UDP-N-acetylglucosamine--N-acetylmuramyl-(pentapeptide) pyrophosphoryl-undecaprenol N-acetylglucosamine transferase [Patescibacteria group bacterium]|jgi:UDP-N-acetylglucosamine--N-acetylmuramyl-(pentapeptide) pyrophosphoryl-undecaprenol N-acetylglucosamine transferase|nr:UDP-N-acetylglucosamine--N-acetylmuramyl-(pentapeptide) pyrophosphoryl-undecaprenol N-acetylglucosamine transferase [Patescibacteria group bacterium]